MARETAHEDDWEDDEDESEDDYSTEDEEALYPCPHCQKEIYEGTERCPYCEQYISREDEPQARIPLWIIVTTVLCFGVVCLWIFR